MKNNIELKSVRELHGMKFFIPSYQRGYRWTEQQVKDLLDDIWEFSNKQNKQIGEFYCLQPLVVKRKDENVLEQVKQADTIDEVKKLLKGYWEVIDGQQRLTTIFILLSYLKVKDIYSLEYATREKSKDFLRTIEEKKEEEKNIDYYHIVSAFKAIKSWFDDIFKDKEEKKETFINILFDNVKFIWYESDEPDPIKVFTRLNIGKISLTNAELIKALFLNRSNFGNKDGEHLRLRQQEIASEWDNIEYTLQNEEFWLFLHANDYNRPTRIEFIFDMICGQKSLGEFNNIGTDKYRIFRYFYEYFKIEKRENVNETNKIETCWSEVKRFFQTFQEWFNDLELYHYVGFLVEYDVSVADLVQTWKEKKTKSDYIEELKTKIKEKIKACNDLNQQYEIDNTPKKTQCRPLLLLHNIQTIINQSKDFKSKKEYKLPVFYKFPFHLFKKEMWDVEHIDSSSENDISDRESQNEFLLNIYYSVDDEIKTKIKDFINNPKADNWNDFSEYTKEAKESLSDDEKNKVWNFTLLDSSTNRSYGNSIFAAKRRIIIGKDRGELLPIPKIKKENKQSKFNIELTEKAETAFIPPCTKNIFLKYYTPILTNYNYWTIPDAEAYKQNIYNTLKDFGVTDSSNNQNEDNNEQQ